MKPGLKLRERVAFGRSWNVADVIDGVCVLTSETAGPATYTVAELNLFVAKEFFLCDLCREAGTRCQECARRWAQHLANDWSDLPPIEPSSSGSPNNSDPVNHPKHYTSSPSGIECIDVVEHMPFCRGNVVKYCFRAGLKGDELEDLRKARWYLEREIARVEKLRADKG